MIQLLLVPLRIAGGMRVASSIGGNRDQKLRGDIQLGMKTNSKELSKKLGKFQSKLSRYNYLFLQFLWDSYGILQLLSLNEILGKARWSIMFLSYYI